MGLIDAIVQGFKAVAAALGLIAQRDAAKNTVDQRSNAEAEQIQADREAARKAIENPDQTDLERKVAP